VLKVCRIKVTTPGFGRRHLRSSFNFKVFLGSHRGREGEKGRTGLRAHTHEQVLSHKGESKPFFSQMDMDQNNDKQ
jgi:hypothetical protein